MTAEEYASTQEEYGGKFIAERDGGVLASADTHGELVRILKEKGLYDGEFACRWIRPKDQILELAAAEPTPP